jgi:hypothetical protein
MFCLLCFTACLAAQDLPPPAPKYIEVEAGRRIPLTFLKGVTTRSAVAGDPIYLQTIFPITAGGRIAIPPGSYVTGSVIESKRAGKVKGRAELRVRLDSVILPDGTTKDFRGGVTGLDSASGEVVDPEGKVTGKGGKLNDVKNIATGAATGAAIGAAAGGLATLGTSGGTEVGDLTRVVRAPAAGAGIGMLAGATTMLVATLFTRGPDAVIAKGDSVDMVLDVPMRFLESELSGRANPPPTGDRTESGLKKREPR